ncbi:MAG: hypothetical protein KGJ23_00755 [Euryarchaeota archaeon]|nr:hypothetical protein [Euryarchaeota archaeon]MDE1835125.1 hypothetical protein [Euryarchaeota archaeon]MDE1880689.1 hypothetical protein [Euryarchaeota archaeon]MDE2044912.1 hypothetical protein [Thermoplasmata archaeon]
MIEQGPHPRSSSPYQSGQSRQWSGASGRSEPQGTVVASVAALVLP